MSTVFGKRLREYRESHHLSQQELADMIGSSKQVISRYETGQRDPKISIAADYAKKLGLPANYFYPEPTEQVQQINSIAEEPMSEAKREMLDLVKSCPEELSAILLRTMKAVLGRD